MDWLPFEITFDWSWVYNLGTQPLHVIVWHYFINGGWTLFLVVFLWGAWNNFVYWRQGIWASKISYTFLAIDIPKDNLQTPKAVENIFTAMAGAHMPLDWHEKTFKGEFQLGFSLELVSIDGFIQYIIRTPSMFRNLVEAAVYGQYPEAEITEVEDYTADINVRFPSEEYNIWGADLVFTNKDYYPIRTYIEFMEEMDSEFKDPMAAILEVMSSIGLGEQIWLQLLIAPADIGWHKAGVAETNKLLGIAEKSKPSKLNTLLDAPLTLMNLFGEQLIGQPILGMGEPAAPDKKEVKMLDQLAPIDKLRVNGIVNKVGKVCYMAKYRLVYFGKKEVFKKGLGVAGMMGTIKQFGSTALNGFKPGSNKTQAKLAFKKQRLSSRQNAILANYKDRNAATCDGPELMSVEEIATIFHFPHIEIKAPLIKRIDSRKSRAPIGLPVSDQEGLAEDVPFVCEENESPANVLAIDYDNDYFEKRFAKDKSGLSDKLRKEQMLAKLQKESAIIQDLTAQRKKDQEEEPIQEKENFEQDFKLEINDEDNNNEDDSENSSPGNLPFVD